MWLPLRRHRLQIRLFSKTDTLRCRDHFIAVSRAFPETLPLPLPFDLPGTLAAVARGWKYENALPRAGGHQPTWARAARRDIKAGRALKTINRGGRIQPKPLLTCQGNCPFRLNRAHPSACFVPDIGTPKLQVAWLICGWKLGKAHQGFSSEWDILWTMNSPCQRKSFEKGGLCSRHT